MGTDVVCVCVCASANRHVLSVHYVSGLRTLCFAVAEISESSYQQWLEVFHYAASALQNRALKLEESYEFIEKVSLTHTCPFALAQTRTPHQSPSNPILTPIHQSPSSPISTIIL